MTRIKICGITSADALAAAAPADFIGLVFFPSSPRALTVETAAALAATAATAAPRLKKVGLFVDPDDALIESVRAQVPLDMIQLHGAETPARVAAIKAATGLPVIKALRIATPADIDAARMYEPAADWLLFDAHVQNRAGGTGQRFDWSLLEGFRSKLPWMLAGGLNAANIVLALNQFKPDAVDVSSGVEDKPGQKNPTLVKNFIETVKSL